MKRAISVAAALALSLAACGESGTEPTHSGPRLKAEQAAVFSDAAQPARQAAFSADGAWLATSSAAGAIVLRHMPDLRIGRRYEHPGGATALAFGPDGNWLASAGYDGAVRIWDLTQGKLLRTLKGSEQTIWSLGLSPDGAHLAAAGEDKIIRIWDVAQGKLLKSLSGHERNVWEVRFSPDGKRLASGSFDESLRLWDAGTGKALGSVSDHEEAIVGLDWSRDGRWLATGGDDSTIRLRRAADGATARVLQVGNHSYKLSFSPDSRWLANVGRTRGGLGTAWYGLTGLGGPVETVRLWRVSDGALVQALMMPDDVMYVAFSPDGRWLVTPGNDGRVTLWRLKVEGDAAA